MSHLSSHNVRLLTCIYVCVPVYQVHVRCPWRSEDSIRSHNTVVTNSCEPPVDAENELRSPQSSQRFLTTELPLQPLPSFYFISAQSHHYSPFILYHFFMYTHFAYMCLYALYAHSAHRGQKRVSDSCKVGYWEPNTGLLEDQPLNLTTEPSL